MAVLGDNLEGKSATFTSLREWIYSELDKRAQHVFSVSGTRIKCITEHESFRPVCLLADVKAETYSFRGGSLSLSFLFIVVSLFFTWMAFFWRWTMVGLENK